MTDPSQSNAVPTPAEWGPPTWLVMRYVAKGYGDHPDAELRASAARYFNSYRDLLPCEKCRAHYAALLRERPIESHLDDTASILAWIDWAERRVRENRTPAPEAPAPANAPALAVATAVAVHRPRVVLRRSAAPPAPTFVRASAAPTATVATSAPRVVGGLRPRNAAVAARNERVLTPYMRNGRENTLAAQRLRHSVKSYSRPCNCQG